MTRMLGRSGHTDYFCMYGKKCKCEVGRRTRAADKQAAMQQLRRREQRETNRQIVDDTCE